jgi:hypothetical protein
MGGRVGGCIGAIDGGVMGQMVGAQMGGRSIALEHIGCTDPLTHRHTQFAFACSTRPPPTTATSAATKANFFMASPNQP